MTDTTTPEFEPAVLVKEGTPLVKPHQCHNHLPPEGHWEGEGDEDEKWVTDLTHGDVYRCTCGTYYRYSERGLSYFWKYDTVAGTSHWARCDEQGRFYIYTEMAPWWKRMWGVSEKEYIIPEEED